MKDYSAMSDFEINKAVAYHLGLCTVIDAENGDYKPCKNPADAWPIIVEQRITVTPYDKVDSGWFATTDTSFFVDDINPLRAAMIVFLMMKDRESSHA